MLAFFKAELLSHFLSDSMLPLSTFLQHLLVSFCTVRYEEKQRKNTWTFVYFMEGLEISSERCVLIFLSLDCNLVMWYALNKKLWNILLLFPIPSHANRKPIWRSHVISLKHSWNWTAFNSWSRIARGRVFWYQSIGYTLTIPKWKYRSKKAMKKGCVWVWF